MFNVPPISNAPCAPKYWLSQMALVQALHMATKGGVPPETFLKVIERRVPVDVPQEVLNGYLKGDFSITDAPMKEWLPGLQKVLSHADGGINAEMLLPVQRLLAQGVSMGLGDEHLLAALKVMDADAPGSPGTAGSDTPAAKV